MPSPGSSPQSSAGQNTTENPEPYYSNEDVAILHDIVVLAQELLPKLAERERLPTNALFSAYYDILPRVGINADHDSRYARVLFKIGGLRGQGHLYTKFEEVLSRMGIAIEFDHEDFDEKYSQIEDSRTDVEGSISGAAMFEDAKPQIERTRRNSESSAWDLGIGIQSLSRQRRNSLSTPLEPRATNNTREGFLQEIRLAQSQLTSHHAQGQEITDHVEGKVRPWLDSGPLDHLPRRRGRSVSTHASLRIRRRSVSQGIGHKSIDDNRSGAPSEDHQTARDITEDLEDLNDVTGESTGFDPARPLQQFNNFMKSKVAMITEHHMNSLVRAQLRTWRAKAIQLEQDNRHLEAIAIDHDRKALLQPALLTWHFRSETRVAQKRKVQETEKFYALLEKRTSRARELYLMHIAFTHWSIFTNEQVQNTALARRHIVRTRIFNAWREITAVNELKVRRQVLRKFFITWKRHYDMTCADNVNSVLKYEGSLVANIYMKWVRRHWEWKASNLWAEAIKRRTLFRWISDSHRTWEDERSARELRRRQLAANFLRVWRAKMDGSRRQNERAESYHGAQLCRKSLRRWRRETLVIPAMKIVQTGVESRLLREIFWTWLVRTRHEKQAVCVDRIRILREALTTWRHQARVQVTIALVERRILQQTLYKWAFAERLVTSSRMVAGKLRVQSIQVWKAKCRMSRENRWEMEDMAQSIHTRRTQKLVLDAWYSRISSQQNNANNAINLYEPRLLQGLLSQWQGRLQHQRKLQQWSRDAEFYFLGSKSLKRWQARTETVKREKRKAAYAQIRRTIKMNLARGLLRNWQKQTQHVLDLTAQSLERSQNRIVIVGMNAFDRWRARAEELTDLETLWRGTILRRHFDTWRDCSSNFQDLATEATITYKEHRQSRVLKKWSLLALHIRSQANYAAEVREKNAKRRFRKIFSYWRQKVAQQRPDRQVEITEAMQVSGELGATARAEAWSDFGDEIEVDEAVGPVSLPGYMSTPSRRTERVMAVAARFSTTPRAPLSTPFERQLRAQYSGGPLPSYRRPPGRSTLGIGEGFQDIKGRNANNE